MISRAIRLVGQYFKKNKHNSKPVEQIFIPGQDYFLALMLRYKFTTILDIGAGPHSHIAEFLIRNGKSVFAIDVQKRFQFTNKNYHFIEGNFLEYGFSKRFDAVLASHVLEHTQNTGFFLEKVYDVLNDGGFFFCLVPPHRNEIVGGHVTIGWNIGILMYNLILSGFDVKNGRFKEHGYNVAAFVKKRPTRDLPAGLIYDKGDIEKLADYWPDSEYFKHGFNGNIAEWNWFEK